MVKCANCGIELCNHILHSLKRKDLNPKSCICCTNSDCYRLIYVTPKGTTTSADVLVCRDCWWKHKDTELDFLPESLQMKIIAGRI